MARDEDDDLYDEDFDFVDEDESDVEDEEGEDSARAEADDTPLDEPAVAEEEEVVDEYGRPEPAANYVVHIYEFKRFKRTVDRAFTPEDAEAFASEYNRTAKPYHRLAVAGKNDSQPKKSLE